MIVHRVKVLRDGEPIITLASGTHADREAAGANESWALASVSYTASVNAETNIAPGSVCSAEVTLEVWSPRTGAEDLLAIQAGDQIVLESLENGDYTQRGIFYAQKPTRSSANRYTVTAYDAVSLLDADASQWLRAHFDDPNVWSNLGRLLASVCTQCELYTTIVPVGIVDLLDTYKPLPFYDDGTTYRQIVQDIVAAVGCFAYVDAEKQFTLDWYIDFGRALGPGQYLQGSLTYEDFTTEEITNVRIARTDDDVGVLYPTTAGDNILVLNGNRVLCSDTTAKLEPVARLLYERLHGTRYTPCKLTLPQTYDILPGEIVHITDSYGKTITACIMQVDISGNGTTLTCTGDVNLNSGSAYSTESTFKNLQGKMLRVKASVEGLTVTAETLTGQVATLTTTVDDFAVQIQDKTSAAQVSTMIEASTKDGGALKAYVDKSVGSIVYDISTKTSTYTGNGTPSRAEEPAASWIDAGEERRHHNDQYYDLLTGYAYLWVENALVCSTGVFVSPNLKVGQPAYDWYRMKDMDIEHVRSELTLTTDAITARVSRGEEQYSELKQTVEGFGITGGVTFATLFDTKVTTISGSKITTGTIDASKVSVTNLNASNITAGKLNANLINAGAITNTAKTMQIDITRGRIITSDTFYDSGNTSELSGTAFVNKVSGQVVAYFGINAPGDGGYITLGSTAQRHIFLNGNDTDGGGSITLSEGGSIQLLEGGSIKLFEGGSIRLSEGGSIKLSGNGITQVNLSENGVYSWAGIDTAGTVTAAAVTTTGAVTAASVGATGAVTAASIEVTGDTVTVNNTDYIPMNVDFLDSRGKQQTMQILCAGIY